MAALPPHAFARETNPGGRVGPPALYPDSNKTPGLSDTLDVGDLTRPWHENCPAHKTTCTYSQAHRDVPTSVHDAVYNSYDVPADARNIQSGEVDHFWPLCAGGSNDLKNLWYQPKENPWNGENLGFKEKDWLEADICKQIKAGTLDPSEAYKRLTTDWVAYYHDERARQDANIVDADDQ